MGVCSAGGRVLDLVAARRRYWRARGGCGSMRMKSASMGKPGDEDQGARAKQTQHQVRQGGRHVQRLRTLRLVCAAEAAAHQRTGARASPLHNEENCKGLDVCDSGDNQFSFPKDTMELDTDLAKELQR